MRRPKAIDQSELFADDLDTDLEAALVAATKPPVESPASEKVETRSSDDPGGDARRRAHLDKIIATPSINEAIAITSIECMSAGYPVMSIGILDRNTLIVQALGAGGKKLDATGSPTTVINTLRDLIKQARQS